MGRKFIPSDIMMKGQEEQRMRTRNTRMSDDQITILDVIQDRIFVVKRFNGYVVSDSERCCLRILGDGTRSTLYL